jgi:hypothetical protein
MLFLTRLEEEAASSGAFFRHFSWPENDSLPELCQA